MPELTATAGQTIGPFFHYALPYPGDCELVPRDSRGSVLLHGFIFDGDGNGIPDALVEIRQTDESGRVPTVEGSLHRDPTSFTGWGRSSTDATGHYWFSTIEPAPTRAGEAAFFAVAVFARGLLNRLFTRCYLPARAELLAADALLGSLGDTDRAGLVAARDEEGNLRFDIHLQGPAETAFLAYPGQG
jgi:protocatechuate 3,4-dioxygenase alpha subunit